ncbi:Clampless protein 1 [Mycena kentingensis (nom. inval.)]|nr:Clampless protein 1 [Mycena kentingensis (nom. inval.)]
MLHYPNEKCSKSPSTLPPSYRTDTDIIVTTIAAPPTPHQHRASSPALSPALPLQTLPAMHSQQLHPSWPLSPTSSSVTPPPISPNPSLAPASPASSPSPSASSPMAPLSRPTRWQSASRQNQERRTSTRRRLSTPSTPSSSPPTAQSSLACLPQSPLHPPHTRPSPVLPLVLPSPPAFAILHTWLYTNRLDTVLSTLFPHGGVPAPFIERLASTYAHASSPSSPSQALVLLSSTFENRSALHALATNLCSTSAGSLSALMMHAGHVKELWQDMVALGICDPGLWAAVDLAWEVVLAAMNLAAQ